MTARISVAVMAHPKRERFVPAILERLDAAATVVWDQQNDRHETGRRSLAAYDPDATHHLVIQDDAIPCRDLVAGAERLLEHVPPDAPVGLYVGRVRPLYPRVAGLVAYSRACGSPWMVMEGPWWGPGIIVPTAHIPPLLDFYDRASAIKNYDKRITRYFGSIGVQCWYTIPSLVEHRADNNPSLVAGRTGRRCAEWWIGDETPASIDWSVPPPPVPASGIVEAKWHGTSRFSCWWCPSAPRTNVRSAERHARTCPHRRVEVVAHAG